MTQRLLTDGASDPGKGVAFVKDETASSPMDDPRLARHLTLALAGRARRLAPLAARHLPCDKHHLLDVAAGTGLFAYYWLLRVPQAAATLVDRPAVLEVASEFLDELCESSLPGAADLRSRVTFLAADMLTDPLPNADLVLTASLFHDWPDNVCRRLANKFADRLAPGGELWVHDVFLNDRFDGPLEATDYSAQLFWFTKGRLYARCEYESWMRQAGLNGPIEERPTGLDYRLMAFRK